MYYFSKTIILCSSVILMTATTACVQKFSKKSQSAENTNQQLVYPREIIPEGASLTKVTGAYSFDTAGSPLYMDGMLYFTNNNFDQPKVSRTLRKNSLGAIDTLALDNGVTTTLQATGKGTIYACEMLGHRVVELNKEGKVINIVADTYKGNRIDGPNDIVVDKKGGLYFSDSQFIAGGEKMQETPAVYYINEQGTIIRVIDALSFPNGLGLSPDGNTMYVANTPGTHLLAYDVNEDGTVQNKQNFAKLLLAKGGQEGGADGMAVDSKGNVYVATTKGIGVQIFDNKGNYLGNIATRTPSNNVSFGGEDNRTLYISAQDGIYSIQVKGKR